MREIVNVLSGVDEFKNICDLIDDRKSQYILGLTSAQKAFYIAGIFENIDTSIFIICENQGVQDRLISDLVNFVCEDRVLSFPSLDLLPYGDIDLGSDLKTMRSKAIKALLTNEKSIIVTTARATMDRMIPKSVLEDSMVEIKLSDEMDLVKLSERLVKAGYERYPKAETKGQMSIKGGLLDIFPYDADLPIRIEFFGDEVESIRTYDPDTQRSRENLSKVLITPSREFLYNIEDAQKAAKKMAQELELCDKTHLNSRINHAIERMEQGIYFENDYQYIPFIYDDRISILDYLSDEVFCIVDEPSRVFGALDGREKDLREMYISLIETGMILPGQADSYIAAQESRIRIDYIQGMGFSLLAQGLSEKELNSSTAILMKSVDSYQGHFDKLAKDISSYKKRGFRVLCAATTKERADNIANEMEERNVVVTRWNEDEIQPLGSFGTTVGTISSGFMYNAAKLVILSEKEIFGTHKKVRRGFYSGEGTKITSYMDLAVGDFVVHVNHGIAQYEGLKTMEVAGVLRDYLILRYAGEDKVFVPTDQVEMLQKYIGAKDVSPKLNKLNGTEWSRAKSKVKASIQDMAKGLLELYAEREKIEGYAFGEDTVWQQEFEDRFPYEETPDQARSIIDIKKDMESNRPMDRLLCGDVGFGKTEVAMRAAFKAAADGKQVAVLVPTTILAQQHFSTFSERFSGFPMTVAVVSRFQSDAEIKATIEAVRRGTVDVLIGTHRLLSKDVAFKNLGLVIIDEEQRFGVSQKEKLKELRKEVDVLTLSATPIPRTLHMAMISVRDMSLIETPPVNRFPIRTHVAEYDDDLLREVIMKEIDRGGQVYFVHNKVKDLDKVVFKLEQLMPDISIGVAHGQMSEERLENTMMKFLNKEFQVLVCTTIIESGIDIQNVNTIIVNDAENFGLAQLYQLRGRVGRTNRIAYAYFFYRKDKIMTDIAERRLAAIKEFTNLGSGYKIAMRDMEIRGVGNILGPEQHGHIATIGFEMYCRLLEETMTELQGKEIKEEKKPILIDISLDAFIPDSYIRDSRDKIAMYKKINSVESMEDVLDVQDEMMDRFGEIPSQVANLVAIANIKNLGSTLGFGNISLSQKIVYLRFADEIRYDIGIIAEATKPFSKQSQVIVGREGRILGIKLKVDGFSTESMLKLIVDTLVSMKNEKEKYAV